MTFTDAVRQLLHDPIRLGAYRGRSSVVPNFSEAHNGFLSVLTTGQLVWKTEGGQRMEPWQATAGDVLAEDWEIQNMVPVQNPPMPDLMFSKPSTGILGEMGIKAGGTVAGNARHGAGNEGRRPSVGGPSGSPQGGIGGKGTL